MARSQLTSLPNLITLARIVVIPIVVALLLTGDAGLRIAAMVIFVAAALSDWLDGYLARRSGLSSPLGRMLDPIADKLLVGITIVVLAWDRSFSAWDLVPALAILGREIFISGLREFLGGKEVVLPVTKLAKWKTTVQLVAFVVVFLEPLVPGLSLASDVALWAAAIITVWTGVQYLMASWPHLSDDAP
jgi:cardiolipin synthase